MYRQQAGLILNISEPQESCQVGTQTRGGTSHQGLTQHGVPVPGVGG